MDKINIYLADVDWDTLSHVAALELLVLVREKLEVWDFGSAGQCVQDHRLHSSEENLAGRALQLCDLASHWSSQPTA